MGSRSRAAVILVLLVAASGCTQAFENIRDSVDGGAGSNYEAYLTGERKLVVELDHSPGAKWQESSRAAEHFVQQLRRITDKTVEVQASQDLPRKGQDYAWTSSELRDLHRNHQDLSSNDEQVVMHALFVDGDYERDNVLGVAFAAQSMAIFAGKIDEVTCSNNAIACPSGEPRQWRLMRSVAIHEAGHLLGLVNSPLSMVNDHEMDEDPDPETARNEGDAHSSNEDSVMFWAVRNQRGLSSIFGDGDVPWEFDTNDVNDAKALRRGSS